MLWSGLPVLIHAKQPPTLAGWVAQELSSFAFLHLRILPLLQPGHFPPIIYHMQKCVQCIHKKKIGKAISHGKFMFGCSVNLPWSFDHHNHDSKDIDDNDNLLCVCDFGRVMLANSSEAPCPASSKYGQRNHKGIMLLLFWNQDTMMMILRFIAF